MMEGSFLSSLFSYFASMGSWQRVIRRGISFKAFLACVNFAVSSLDESSFVDAGGCACLGRFDGGEFGGGLAVE